MRSLLEGLGLTSYESKALEHLLRHGPRTGPDLSRESGVPFGRVYDTLNALAERGLVVVEAGRPKHYAAVAAGTVPGRLLAAERRRLQQTEQDVEARAQELESELTALAPKSEPASHSYGVRMGEDSARAFLIEATHEARETVLAYLAFDRIQDEDLQLFGAFRHAVARGVHTRVLLRAADVDYLMTTPYVDEVLDALLPHLGQTLEVRLTWQDAVPYAALDGQRAMLGVKNPLDPTAYFAVIHVDDPAFADGLGAKFDAMWAEAEEPRDLIQWALGNRGGKALLKFGARLRRRGDGEGR